MTKAIKISNMAANLVERQFREYRPRKLSLTDITYILYNGKFCYLSTILDEYYEYITIGIYSLKGIIMQHKDECMFHTINN